MGEEVGKEFWEAVREGVVNGGGGRVGRVREGVLPLDAGGVQGGASGSSDNIFVCEPCGAGASGSGGVVAGPCGAGASGLGAGEPWEVAGASGSGDVCTGDEEVAALWWGVGM